MKNLQQKVLDAIISDGDKTTKGDKFDNFIIPLIVLNVLAVIAESYPHLEEKFHDFFYYFEMFSVVIFTLEYLLRIWVAPLIYTNKTPFIARVKFIFSALAIVDVLAILPFYLPFVLVFDLRILRLLRLLRLLRVLKLSRHSESMMLIIRVLKKTKKDIGVTIFVVFILLVVSASLMFNIENEAQPVAFSNIGQGFWWAVATLTTVGYGDIYPVTALGKFISGFIALMGIGLVALPTGIISSAFIFELEERKKEEAPACSFNHAEMTTRFCPHCGVRL
ncbi:MAG: ion transporter [Ichthyobacteriaceae bacterium]|nr:ion transporter [Ichthyobacteriaceae bacterium]